MGEDIKGVETPSQEGAVNGHEDGLSVCAAGAHVVKRVLAHEHSGADLTFSVIVIGSHPLLIQEGEEAVTVTAHTFEEPPGIRIIRHPRFLSRHPRESGDPWHPNNFLDSHFRGNDSRG